MYYIQNENKISELRFIICFLSDKKGEDIQVV